MKTEIRIVLLTVTLCLIAGAGTVRAGPVGTTEVYATYVHSQYHTLAPDSWVYRQSYYVETRALSTGSDTVLHVFDAATGQLVASNDDSNGTLASFVSIPSWMNGRTMRIVVHAYSSGSPGNAVLHIHRQETFLGTPGNWWDYYYGIDFAGSRVWVGGPLPAGTHFFTSRLFEGSQNTMLLALATTTHPNGLSDDEGVGLMSAIHLAEACSSLDCSVVVGTFDPYLWNYRNRTKLTWDADAHVLDTDQDGLSDTLEGVLGTSPSNADTDLDGIKDGEEVLGVDDATLPLHFQLYGADPTQPDIFVQADWEECVPRSAQDWFCGDPLNPDPDALRIPPADAILAASMYAPEMRLHIDSGIQNWDVASAFIYNAWGGAARYTMTSGFCDQLNRTPSRVGYFHGGRITYMGGGHSMVRSACFESSNSGYAYAHELAHNMNIYDGGAPSTGVAPCKPNHRSQMNYAFVYEPGIAFSRAEFPWFVPARMNEQTGLGTTDPAMLAHLQLNTMRYTVNADGSVDWNRDGQIGDVDALGNYTPIVRAAPTWAWGWNCNVTAAHATYLPANLWDASFAWLGGKLYLFSRRTADSLLEYRKATGMPDECSISAYPCNNTTWTAPALVSSAPAVSSSAAVARYEAGGIPHLFLTYADGNGKLRYQLLTVTNGIEYWSAPLGVGTGAETIWGSPAVVASNGAVEVFAPSGTALKRWTFDPRRQTFSGPNDQVWDENGAPITPIAGVGVTTGYIQDGNHTNPAIVAAIPTSPSSIITFAWLARGDRWARSPNFLWVKGGGNSSYAQTLESPGVAFVPFDGRAGMSGRFYIAWKSRAAGTDPQAPSAPEINMTEGNDVTATATSRRLMTNLDAVSLSSSYYTTAIKGVSLLFDPLYDRNLRASYTTDSVRPAFLPAADGVFNMYEGDNDEYAFLRSNLACALGKGTCNY